MHGLSGNFYDDTVVDETPFSVSGVAGVVWETTHNKACLNKASQTQAGL